MDSLRLLLEDYLSLMKEDGELDAFVPLLLSAMGHEIIFRPQKGIRQYGVDALSVGPDEDGTRKYFMWLIKRGAVDRTAWDAGSQSVHQSMQEVGTVHLRLHVRTEFSALPKKLVVLTNGDFSQSLEQNLKGAADDWRERFHTEIEYANGSRLARWTEKHLLNEYVLTAPSRPLFRRLLANVDAYEVGFAAGVQFIDSLVSNARMAEGTKGAKRKRLLTILRGIRTSLLVLYVWGLNEKNLVVPYRVTEYAVLKLWQEFHADLLSRDADVIPEFQSVLAQLFQVAFAYHQGMWLYYQTENAFAATLGDNLLVANRVFEEIGRLGLQGTMCAFFAVSENSDLLAQRVEVYATGLQLLLGSHSCAASPAFEHQAVDVHAALLLLLMTGRKELAVNWVESMTMRFFRVVTGYPRFRPIAAAFDDALLIRQGFEEPSQDFFETTIFAPILLLWTAALGLDEAYRFLRDEVGPKLGKTSLNFWVAPENHDSLMADGRALTSAGAGQTPSISTLGEPEEFLQRYAQPFARLPSIENSSWHQLRAAYIPLLSALFWRLQLPREMLFKQALAVTRLDGVPNPD